MTQPASLFAGCGETPWDSVLLLLSLSLLLMIVMVTVALVRPKLPLVTVLLHARMIVDMMLLLLDHTLFKFNDSLP